jgi:NAD+ synthetase
MLRLAIAQIRPKKADYAENLRRVGAVLAQAAKMDEPPDLILFAETIMSGYFLEGGVRDAAVSAGTLFRDLAAQHELSGAPPVEISLGFYEEFKNRIFNAAMYASLGGPDAGIRHIHRKIFLPTYGVFDESRFVDKGQSVQAFDTRWGRAAMVVCEDAWHSLVPTVAALDGAQLIIVPSASPARGPVPSDDNLPASVSRWEAVLKRIADEHGVFVALAQLVGFEGGKGFQGASVLVDPHGDVVVRAPAFDEAIISATLDLSELTRARAAQPLLADLEVQLPNLLKPLGVEVRTPLEYAPENACPTPAMPVAAAKHRVITPEESGDPLAIDAAMLTSWLAEFLKAELTGRGFKKGIVGLSGGVDSAVTAALAVRALGKDNVIGVRLPYRTSSAESLNHAALVAETLGIKLETIDISAALDGYYASLGEQGDPGRRGNVMARLRMIALFDLSAKHKALPLGTGNKTERLLGYFTWHADDSPPVNPLGDLFKTQVWALAKHLGVPDTIVKKPATADLITGQTDEQDLGISYSKADHILHGLVRGLSAAEVQAQGFTADEVALVRRRLDSTHWKRRLPTVAMISNTAIGEYYLRPVDY